LSDPWNEFLLAAQRPDARTEKTVGIFVILVLFVLPLTLVVLSKVFPAAPPTYYPPSYADFSAQEKVCRFGNRNPDVIGLIPNYCWPGED
jgi:hypothetical protein